MTFLTRTAVSAVIAALALAVLLLPTQAADEVDQEASLLPPDGIQTWAGGGVDVLRQTFTPDQDTLTRVDVYLESLGAMTTAAVTVTMEVKEVGSGSVVGNEVLVIPNGFDNDWIIFDFATTAVTPGDLYAIELAVNDDTAGLAWGWINDAYPDGQSGYIDLDTDILTPVPAQDFLFMAYFEAAECGQVLFGTLPPPEGGFGTFALSCGTLDELLTASGCSEGTAVFFYNKPDGGFAVYIPASEVEVVNAEFMAIFSDDPAIAQTTIFTATCPVPV